MNQYDLLPKAVLDEEGYPTEEWLKFLREYEPDDSLPIISFVEKVLVDGWVYSDWGFKLHKASKGKRELELHTGGWSGNESTIKALLSNIWLTEFKMKYVRWRTGGHYYFEIKVDENLK